MRLFILILIPVLLEAEPCRLAGKFEGILSDSIGQVVLTTKRPCPSLWSLSCRIDTTTWNQWVEWSPSSKSRPKVFFTFRSNHWTCLQDEGKAWCSIVSDLPAEEGKTIVFAPFRKKYTCMEGDQGNPPYEAICLKTDSLFIPASDFIQKARAALKKKNGK